MKTVKKILLLALLGIIILNFNNIYVYAAGDKDKTADSTATLRSSMNPWGKSKGDAVGDSNLKKVLAQIFTVIQLAGTGISIIMVMWCGISYMVSSVEQKAELKKRMVPILIGSILIVSSVNILKFISILVTTSLGTSSGTS